MLTLSILRQRSVAVFRLSATLCFIVSLSVQALAADDLEALFDQSDMPGDIEQLLLDLQQLKLRKIPLNTATEEDLLLIPLLTLEQARAIVEYRGRKGPIASPEQLAEAVGSEMAGRISPFLSFEPVLLRAPEKRPELKASWYGRYFSEIPERKGITEGKYEGENYKLYNRLSIAYGGFAVNGVMEKDVGEPERDDFTSLSAAYRGEGLLEQIVAGNYAMNIGQGLLFGQSRYFSKGVDPLGVKLAGRRLKAYTSSAENGFMQGAAATVHLEPFRLTAFYSVNKVDASIKDSVITTIRTSGYHRTESEIEHKDNATERALGVNLLYRLPPGPVGGTIGGTWARYRYSPPLEDTGGTSGWTNTGSLEADLLLGRVNLFAEAAVTGELEHLSWIGGMKFPLTPEIRSVLAVRNYHEAYFSPFAGAFAERADNGSNEEGYYVGIEADILRNLTAGAYYDIFRFPELSSYYRLPSTGDESKIFLGWRQSPALTLEMLYQNQHKEEAKKLLDTAGLEYYTPVPVTTNRVRLDLIGKVSRILTLKTRGEIKFVEDEYPEHEERSDGWLLYQQAGLKKGPLALLARYTRFDTDNFDSAIYVYENDLPLVFTLKSYYGRGQAFFALLSWDILESNSRLPHATRKPGTTTATRTAAAMTNAIPALRHPTISAAPCGFRGKRRAAYALCGNVVSCLTRKSPSVEE